jgi:hypothetical protein
MLSTFSPGKREPNLEKPGAPFGTAKCLHGNVRLAVDPDALSSTSALSRIRLLLHHARLAASRGFCDPLATHPPNKRISEFCVKRGHHCAVYVLGNRGKCFGAIPDRRCRGAVEGREKQEEHKSSTRGTQEQHKRSPAYHLPIASLALPYRGPESSTIADYSELASWRLDPAAVGFRGGLPAGVNLNVVMLRSQESA